MSEGFEDTVTKVGAAIKYYERTFGGIREYEIR